jgi:hypothetical protein
MKERRLRQELEAETLGGGTNDIAKVVNDAKLFNVFDDLNARA